MQLGAINQYDRDHTVGILNGAPIPKKALEDEDEISREIAVFLLFINELNSGLVV